MKNIIAKKEFTATVRDRRFVVAGAVVLLLLLVATSTAAHRDYLQQIKDFHGHWNTFFLPKTFKNERLKPSDYALFPKWEYQSSATEVSVLWGLLKLLILTAGVFGLGWVRLK